MAPPEKDLAKELARKLHWAVTSTCPNLTRQQRSSTFTWAADLADKILSSRHPALPPPVDRERSNGYNGQAVGRGGGKNGPSIPGALPRPGPTRLEDFTRRRDLQRARAWAYVLKGREDAWKSPGPSTTRGR